MPRLKRICHVCGIRRAVIMIDYSDMAGKRLIDESGNLVTAYDFCETCATEGKFCAPRSAIEAAVKRERVLRRRYPDRLG
jgi:hypothetical protein